MERSLHTGEVAGSIPAAPTITFNGLGDTSKPLANNSANDTRCFAQRPQLTGTGRTRVGTAALPAFRVRIKTRPRYSATDYRDMRAELRSWAKDKSDSVQSHASIIVNNLRIMERNPNDAEYRTVVALRFMRMAAVHGHYKNWPCDDAPPTDDGSPHG